MDERRRKDELEKLRTRRLIFWAVLVSILVHVFFLLVFYLVPGSAPPPAAGEKPIWVDMSDVDLPSKNPGRIMSAPLPSNGQAPPKSEHLAANDNSVEKQTHRTDIPINDNSNPVGPRSSRPPSQSPSGAAKKYKVPEVGQGMEPRSSEKGQPDKSAQGEGTMKKSGGRSSDDLINSVGYSTARGGAEGGGGNLSPFNPDVGEPGSAVNLNTKNFKYVGYFSGIKEKIEWAWVYPQDAQQMGQQGMLTISFTILRSGQLADVKQVRSSGFPLLDRAAIRAIKDAADFAPFPDAWPDKEITIVANFQYMLIGAKSVY